MKIRTLIWNIRISIANIWRTFCSCSSK